MGWGENECRRVRRTNKSKHLFMLQSTHQLSRCANYHLSIPQVPKHSHLLLTLSCLGSKKKKKESRKERKKKKKKSDRSRRMNPEVK